MERIVDVVGVYIDNVVDVIGFTSNIPDSIGGVGVTAISIDVVEVAVLEFKLPVGCFDNGRGNILDGTGRGSEGRGGIGGPYSGGGGGIGGPYSRPIFEGSIDKLDKVLFVPVIVDKLLSNDKVSDTDRGWMNGGGGGGNSERFNADEDDDTDEICV